MTYEEIIQALRCCAEGECKDCAMHVDKQRCQENLLDKAADLIERLTAENAALRGYELAAVQATACDYILGRRTWQTGEDVMHWWMEDGVLPGQMVLEGMEDI